MRIGDLFNLHRGKKGSPVPEGEVGKTPYIAAASRNNSQVGWVNEDALFPGGWLAIVNTGAGGVGYCTFQPVPFWASNNVTALEPKQQGLPAHALMVMASIIRSQCFGLFSYGSIANNQRVTNQRIMVPVLEDKEDVVVDWNGMELLGQELMERTMKAGHNAQSRIEDAPLKPPVLNHAPMLITDVFDSYRQTPGWVNINDVRPGISKYPHVTNSANANSVTGFIGEQSCSPNLGNAISIGIDTQVVAYQPVSFYGATKVFELRSSRLNEANALVLATSLKRALEKFSWGYKASAKRLAKTHFMVPIIQDELGNDSVDWDGMEQYGKWLLTHVNHRASQVWKL